MQTGWLFYRVLWCLECSFDCLLIWRIFTLVCFVCAVGEIRDKLVSKLPVHKKNPFVPLVYIHCSSECFCTGLEHTHAQWSPLYYCACSFLILETSTMASFPTLTSSVWKHVMVNPEGLTNVRATRFLVWPWWSRTRFMCSQGTVASSPQPYSTKIHRNLARTWLACVHTCQMKWTL